MFPASNGYATEPLGCRIPFGSYVFCQVQRVDSCPGHSFTAFRGIICIGHNDIVPLPGFNIEHFTRVMCYRFFLIYSGMICGCGKHIMSLFRSLSLKD